MAYVDTLGNLSEASGTRMVALHARYKTGDLTLEQFVIMAAALLTTARSAATALADAALAAELTRLWSTITPTIGLASPAPATGGQVRDVLDSDPYRIDPAAAIAVLGRAVTLQAAQDAYTEGMRTRGVAHWRRVPNRGACPVCTDLTSGVVPIDEAMWTHRGCGCTQRPIA